MWSSLLLITLLVYLLHAQFKVLLCCTLLSCDIFQYHIGIFFGMFVTDVTCGIVKQDYIILAPKTNVCCLPEYCFTATKKLDKINS